MTAPVIMHQNEFASKIADTLGNHDCSYIMHQSERRGDCSSGTHESRASQRWIGGNDGAFETELLFPFLRLVEHPEWRIVIANAISIVRVITREENSSLRSSIGQRTETCASLRAYDGHWAVSLWVPLPSPLTANVVQTLTPIISKSVRLGVVRVGPSLLCG